MNAVLRSLGVATGTIHCRDEDPTNCGPEIAGQLKARFGSKRFGLVGLQPAILKGLTKHFAPEFVRVVDLNPDNIGNLKFGVEVWDEQTDLQRLVEWSEVGLGQDAGNIDADPLFADPANCDYHLMSLSGRWDPTSQSWVQNGVSSPCIDAGDPNSDIRLEPDPNGSVINIGAYGGTAQASKSP